ncbi:MAG: hypothetical protein K0R09_2288, partial [Clostridiales bacterium]|nr:hypothetical protein [Clostridiales bacterium]
MFKLFGNNEASKIYCSISEPTCVFKALEDLKEDVFKISGLRADIIKSFPFTETSSILVGTITNEKFAEYLKENNIDITEIENKWEHFIIKTFGRDNQCLLICGSDKRGTMWGIYEFCEKILGIDPLYFWTDHEPVKTEEFIIPPISINDGPKTYKFRGWFINDEDLLMGWAKKGTPQEENDFFREYPLALEKILETALRLKQNVIIPSTYLDVDDPIQENVVRIITERGLYISHHHQEPVGVKQSTIDRYWKNKGFEFPVNYYENPEKYVEVWNYYINKWAKYEDVIWQLGLRGKGDRPV